jgi:O-acetyl-ADP-ribose deacetylase (regulator of RNase III)
MEQVMCPVCIANAAVMAASVTSSGGVAALIVARFRRFAKFRKPGPEIKAKEKKS